MVFQFEHITTRWDKSHGKWLSKPADLSSLRGILNKWQMALAQDGWNSLFWSNHDLPRAVSAWGCDGEFRDHSAKMLATVLHLMRGTPYVYQGEEIGMTNAGFTSISQYRDIETLAKHRSFAGKSDAEITRFLAAAQHCSRDNARTPMQWTAGKNAGFSSGTPWIDVNPNHAFINVENSIGDANSVWSHYKKLISLRKSRRIIVYGDYIPLLEDDPYVFAYARRLDRECIVVIANFTVESVTAKIPAPYALSGRCLVFNVNERTEIPPDCALRPFEAFAVLAAGHDLNEQSSDRRAQGAELRSLALTEH